MENTINNRLLALIEHLGLNPNAFAVKAGIPAPSLHHIIGHRQTEPGFAIINKILNAFPIVNTHWLMTGEGDMIRKFGKVFTRDSEEVKRLTKSEKQQENSFSQAFVNKRFTVAFHEVIKKYGLTKKVICERIGIYPTHLNDYFSGFRKINDDIIQKMETTFGVRPEYILMGHEKVFNYENDNLNSSNIDLSPKGRNTKPSIQIVIERVELLIRSNPKFSKDDLGIHMGKSGRQYFYDLEGRKDIGINELTEIAKYFDMDVAYFLGAKPQKFLEQRVNDLEKQMEQFLNKEFKTTLKSY